MANHSQQQNETLSFSLFSASECIALVTVYGIEAVAIVMLNALTIIAFLKESSLRKRNMYLVINQAVADMFVGAHLINNCLFVGHICELWTINLARPILDSLLFVSLLASFINLGAISLERTHAMFRPFKHRLIKKKMFGATTAIVWITAGAISTAVVLQTTLKPLSSKPFRIIYISYLSSFLFCLLTIIASYSSMAIKIVYGTQPHHRSATIRGRKLTKTLFIVTIVSLLLPLPYIIFLLCMMLQLRISRPLYLFYPLIFMFYANSLVNPILYAFRMPEFKRALLSILHCRSQQQPAPGFPLNEM